MEIERIETTSSTNDYLLSLSDDREVAVVTDYQTSGKGMGTNTWESEAGKNLLFSILIHPDWLPIARQYLLSMAEAIALVEVMREVTGDEAFTIKWPNDIYWQDKKVSGTRIDVNLQGFRIHDMVIGTGININQRVFRSDAPNPASLWQITGREYDADDILRRILERFDRYRTLLQDAGEEKIMAMYHENLYRRHGMHRYEDEAGEFDAELVGVAPNGIMTLRRSDGTLSRYEFKEVKFII